MASALKEAERAFEENEVPVGAVVVFENKIIGKGHNRNISLNDPTAHAEIIAITAACDYLGSQYLNDCEIYVTLEPCVMCAGAILNAGIKTLYFGAFEPKFGACGSVYNLLEGNKYNRNIQIYNGIFSDESQSLLKAFFKEQRSIN